MKESKKGLVGSVENEIKAYNRCYKKEPPFQLDKNCNALDLADIDIEGDVEFVA